MTPGPNQTLWLAALRSGSYAQGTGYLKKDDRFCCLGVACEIFPKPQDLKIRLLDDGVIRFGSTTTKAPDYVIEALQLHSELGGGRLIADQNLAKLNDEGKTFAELADLIEASPATYFRKSQ